MEFQGFQNTLPVIFQVAAAIALLALSWFSYRKIKSIPSLPRWVLIMLRASALIILFLLFLNPFFYSSREVEVKPEMAVFLDNSESVSIQKGSYNGSESYNRLLNELAFTSRNELDISYYSIGSDTKPFHPDSLGLNENETNISRAVETILAREEKVKAAVLISDGIYTFGKDPSFSASNSAIPLYTVALGDTSEVRDVAVSNILTNSTGYTNTNHVVEAEISQSGYQNSTIRVSLSSGGEVLAEKNVTFETQDQVKEVEFEIEFSETGLQQFQIQTEELADEWSVSNNNSFFSVDVLDSKVRILDIAFEIHPDVKALRSIIESDVNNELHTLTWIKGSRFIEDIPSEGNFNLVVIHGLPDQNLSLPFSEAVSGVPTIYFTLPSTLQHRRIGLFNETRLISNSSLRISPVTLSPLLNEDEQPIMELPEISYESLPVLDAPLRASTPEVQAVDLFSSAFENIDTNSPVISVLEQGNIRRAHVNAWNWFKITQSTNVQHRAFVTDLMSNMVSWTSSDPDTRNLQIAPTKQSFSTSETPSVNASLQNESGAKESDAIIEIQVSSEGEEPRSFNMDNAGNGNYRLDLPRLSEGLYEFEAIARKGNREIDRQSGEFLVSNSNTELTDTKRNDALLKSIARSTGGSYFTYSDVSAFWDSLETSEVFRTQTRTVENYEFPVRSVYWFILVLLLLGSEWMLRKYYSLP